MFRSKKNILRACPHSPLVNSSYCMNVYESSLWRYNNHNQLERFCISWQIIRKLWKIPYRTHNSPLHLNNKCDSIVNSMQHNKIALGNTQE